ncbi:hypothetical protein, partial [Yersinia enterocolitica]|uniref:hypothetical protein n=1 Tax=Yersinia enterocolitica TaxID=630 RepID=UPI001E3DE799
PRVAVSFLASVRQFFLSPGFFAGASICFYGLIAEVSKQRNDFMEYFHFLLDVHNCVMSVTKYYSSKLNISITKPTFIIPTVGCIYLS